jgi:hypothetical protein
MSSRHTAADAAFLEAKSKLQRYHLEADPDADDNARSKMEAAVAACAVTRDGYADACLETSVRRNPSLVEGPKKQPIKAVLEDVAAILKHTLPNRLPGEN